MYNLFIDLIGLWTEIWVYIYNYHSLWTIWTDSIR